jgi:iron complex transport system ATP-binding protein
MKSALLECRDVSFGYGARTVLQGMSFGIGDGDFVGVIGPNGAGKTTLTKVLSGLLRPSEGVVALMGADMKSLSKREVAAQVAVVQQEETPDFGFTVTEEVMMGRAPHHGGLYFEGRSDRVIVQEAMDKTRVTHLAERRIETLSGGERQRVRIARALAQQPLILLLDEPTNHLDLYSQLSVMELLREIHSHGLSILLVSHDINFVAALCKSVRIIKEGALMVAGAPADVITEENMALCFDIRALVDINPVTDAPRVTPLGRLNKCRDSEKYKKTAPELGPPSQQ